MDSKWALTLLSCGLIASYVVARTMKDTVEEVKEVLNRANAAVRARGLELVPAPDYSFSLPVFGSVDVAYGKVGNLSTLEVRRETDQHLNKSRATDGSLRVQFDVSVGLEEIQLSYNFLLRWMLLFTKHGTVIVKANSNTVSLRGTLSQSSEGSCSAELTDATFTDLSDYSVTLEPKNLINTSWGYLFDLIYNSYLNSQLFTIADSYLKLYLTDAEFKKNFSDILCDSFV